MSEKVVLVDKFDNEIGIMEKMEAHQKGIQISKQIRKSKIRCSLIY